MARESAKRPDGEQTAAIIAHIPVPFLVCVTQAKLSTLVLHGGDPTQQIRALLREVATASSKAAPLKIKGSAGGNAPCNGRVVF